jgi:hypothetical protein
MSVSITLNQTNSTHNDQDNQPVYKSENEVSASEGIPLALFVFAVATDLFSHVAAVRDLEAYPVSKAQAVTDGVDFYRLATATREYDNITDALEFATHVRSRLDFLAQDYPKTQGEFVGSATYQFTTSGS